MRRWRLHTCEGPVVFALPLGSDMFRILAQVPDGGWFPLAMAVVVFAVAAVWHWGCMLRLRAGRASSARLIEDLLRLEEEPGCDAPPCSRPARVAADAGYTNCWHAHSPCPGGCHAPGEVLRQHHAAGAAP